MQNEEKKYGIWEYMSEQHGLTLLESEVHEIIRLARAEMELPDMDEIAQEAVNEARLRRKRGDDFSISDFIDGANWALGKVRKPYPKQINP